MTQTRVLTTPFPHTNGAAALSDVDADQALAWFKKDAPWRLRIASFYEQWEMSVDADTLPADLRHLCGIEFIVGLATRYLRPISDCELECCDITAHKLVKGQTIRIHNDFIEGQESHRILVQVNGGWRDEQGGLLLLFGSGSATDLSRAVRPAHGSGFGFEISPRSFHAVSTIHEGERYTLVYSFRRRPDRVDALD